MNGLDFGQILDGLGQGIAVLDEKAVVLYWNPWMERASGLRASDAVGAPIIELFPSMDTPSLRRNFKSVLSFGISAYISNRLHRQRFPFKPLPGAPEGFDLMQQNCVMGPVSYGDGERAVYVTVEDVTETAFYQRKLVELAIRDVLTTAYNRRYFDQRLLEEIERARRYSHELSLIMLDIDYFKTINDRFGHPFGDEALRRLVSVCEATVRTTDIVTRYGGEEFCVILPETGIDEAIAFAERLRAAVAASSVEAFGLTASMTISLGVSARRDDDEGLAILDRADKGLYAAKAAGRDRAEAVP